MMLNLARDSIFVTLAGSHAHGTAGARSDIDLRGVCIAPLPLRVSLFQHFDQFTGTLEGALWDQVRPRLAGHSTARFGLAGKVESVIYDLAKFLQLCAAANPSALEILFADERDWMHETEAWRSVHAERYRFLTKKARATYLGYGLAQLKKIEAHRAWLLSPPTEPPSREQFGLPGSATVNRDDQDRIEHALAEKVRSYGIDTLELPKDVRVQLNERLQALWADALRVAPDGLDDAMLEVAATALPLPTDVSRALEAERAYRGAVKKWKSYRTWQAQRNPARAELERRYGYDTKHGMHLLRLLHTGIEVLTYGELHVRRADALELIAVRDGALTFDQLLERAKALQHHMDIGMENCTLPADVDRAFVDELALSLIAPST